MILDRVRTGLWRWVPKSFPLWQRLGIHVTLNHYYEPVPGLSRLVPARIQDVPLTEFAELAENDILFIDSSHVLRIGSDVQVEYLDILPRLNPGVLVHVHDVLLPAEYRKEWVLKRHPSGMSSTSCRRF